MQQLLWGVSDDPVESEDGHDDNSSDDDTSAIVIFGNLHKDSM